MEILTVDIDQFIELARDPKLTREELEKLKENALARSKQDFARIADDMLRERFTMQLKKSRGKMPGDPTGGCSVAIQILDWEMLRIYHCAVEHLSCHRLRRLIHRGKPPALPGDSKRFDLCGGRAGVSYGG